MFDALESGAAANRFVAAARSAGIDLRDLRLRLANGDDKDELSTNARLAEYERMLKMAYPEQWKMQQEIERLRADNRQLRADVARKQKDTVSKDVQAENRTLKAEKRALEHKLAEQLDKNLLVKSLREVVGSYGPHHHRKSMDRDELRVLLERLFKPSKHITVLEEFGFAEGPPDNVPPWLRVLLRWLRDKRIADGEWDESYQAEGAADSR